MAAFVVLSPLGQESEARRGRRLNIFPGAATPAVFPARAPFWIGYGFVPEPSDADSADVWAEDRETRFELEVDGRPVTVATDVTVEGGRTVSKRSLVDFQTGLPVGWHRFSGRWYEGGTLALTSERTIEFVER